MQKNLSQPIVRGRNAKDVVYYSQPSSSSSSSSLSQNSSLDDATSKENDQLVNSLIRYLLTLDEGKQIISKARIIKNVFGNRGKHFAQTMNKAKNLLSMVQIKLQLSDCFNQSSPYIPNFVFAGFWISTDRTGKWQVHAGK